MEGQTQFQTALKKTVIMFKTLTGKEITEEEGSIFINLLDMTEGYLSPTITMAAADQWPVTTLAELAKGFNSHINSGTSGMVVSVGQGEDISVEPVTAEQIYQLKDPEQPKATGIDAACGEPYVAQPITNSSRAHIQGYDWQISVLSREKDPADSYVVHFANKPTQGQFEEHFVKFIARTHYVHVNEWNGAWSDWMSITNVYEIAHLSKPEQDRNPRWECEDMAFRIRHFDRKTGALCFHYVRNKPSSSELAHFHHTKGFAVVQSKVG